MPIDKTDIASIAALEPTKMLMMLATIKTITPTKSHLPMLDKSRLMTVAKLAITKKTPAVPPKAVITSSVPFLKPKTIAMSRESISPMKKVKPSKKTIPKEEFLFFSMA